MVSAQGLPYPAASPGGTLPAASLAGSHTELLSALIIDGGSTCLSAAQAGTHRGNPAFPLLPPATSEPRRGCCCWKFS